MTDSHEIAALIEKGGDPYEIAETICGLMRPPADPIYTDGSLVRPKGLTTDVVLGIPYRDGPSEEYPQGTWVYPLRGSDAKLAEDKIEAVIAMPISIEMLMERAASIAERICPAGYLPTRGQEQDIQTLAQLTVLAKRGVQASVVSTNFVGLVHALIYSMIERGVVGDDGWWGQDFLAVKKALERRGLDVDPGQEGVIPPPLREVDLENGMRLTLEGFEDRVEVTVWGEDGESVFTLGEYASLPR